MNTITAPSNRFGLSLSDVAKKLDNTKNGTFLAVSTETPVTLSAKARKEGYTAIHCKTGQYRTGVAYENTSRVAEARANGMEHSTATNNYTAILENKLYFNSKTNEYYIQLVAKSDFHAQSRYIVTDKDGKVTEYEKKEDFAHLLTPSALTNNTKTDSPLPLVQRVKFNNVVAI